MDIVKKVFVFYVFIKINHQFEFTIHNKVYILSNIILLIKYLPIHQIDRLKFIQYCGIEKLALVLEKVDVQNHVSVGFLDQTVSQIYGELTHKLFRFFVGVGERGIIDLFCDFVVKVARNFCFFAEAVQSVNFALNYGVCLFISLNQVNEVSNHVRRHQNSQYHPNTRDNLFHDVSVTIDISKSDCGQRLVSPIEAD